jgi:tRNA dimethylallyltransferase
MKSLQSLPENGKPRVIVVCGPTAVGKTRAGIALAQALNGEIVSADSMQVYRGMDIGTAKPTAEERAAATHHLIDIVEPDEPFDAAVYGALARDAVAGLHRRGKVPVVVGGTGLYIKALLRGLFRAGGGDPALRRRLRAEAEALGAERLHARLAECDPAAAARLHPNDTFRVLRALEVYELTGRPISGLQQEHGFAETPFAALTIGLTLDRATLYQRIDRRVDAMVAAGLEQEVRCLLDRGFGPELTSMQSIGYSHMTAFVGGALTWEECLRTLKRDTRRFAKRQLTWFRSEPGIVWTAPDRTEEITLLARRFLGPA